MYGLSEKILMGLIVLVFLGGLSFGAYVLISKRMEDRQFRVNDETNCLVDRSPPASTAFVVDQSSPFEPRDQERFRTMMRDEIMLLPKHGQFSLYSIAQNPAANAPIDSFCSPGATIDWANENVNRAIERYERFLREAEEQANNSLATPRGDVSPLLETFADIADRVEFDPGIESRRLVVISDFMQYYGDLDFYREIPDVQALDTRPDRALEADFSDVCVLFRRVRRPGETHDIAALSRFWENYFRATGAEITWVTRRTHAYCMQAPP